jgi:predicted ester cyclase
MDDQRELVLDWLATFNEGDASAAGRLVATRYHEHARAPFGGEPPGMVEGSAHLRASVAWLRGQYPDLRMTPEAIVVQGDLIATRVRSTGTNLGPVAPGIPPTGRRFQACQSHWFRVEDGRLAEHWATRDDLVAMLQLGLVAPVRAATREAGHGG